MDFQLLLDPASAAIVLFGTVLATAARSGWQDCRTTVHEVLRLAQKPFNLALQRGELAHGVEEMRHDGVIRAKAGPVSDREFADVTAALVRHRSTAALIEEHRRHVGERSARRQRAITTLSEAGDLSPVLGLAGTLLALSQLPATGLASEGAVMAAVSQAVVSTFYGLTFGHLVFLPLASAIARRGRREEEGREELVQWLVRQLGPACPRSEPRPLVQDHAA